ncbi:hypothetical protein TrCOL_g766 [Triparma columacea]|nr:hypothetical protein TrCOL_g766 [Triparma columacea]
MLLVGSCVGMITPIMPYIVEDLSLSTAQFGYVISAFGFAKLLGNIPSAILVERHGRKPYLVYSLLAVGAGTAGIGFAGALDQLLACRLAVGLGVAALSTSATLTITDISTPNNRASTMAPVMAAFAAGTALGPAVGGILADSIGVQNTFSMIGVAFLGNAVLNGTFLTETKSRVSRGGRLVYSEKDKEEEANETFWTACTTAVGQWQPLLKNRHVRNAIILNSCYWVSLSGAQMTLLPLFLTDPTLPFAMTAATLGKVYAGMSIVQVLGSQPLAILTDKIGKKPVIIAGSAIVGGSICLLTQCSTLETLAATLGLWSVGGVFLSTAPIAYVSDLVEEGERAQAIALLRTCGDVGLLVGATTTGMLADISSIEGAMAFSGGVLLTATSWYVASGRMGGNNNQKDAS